MKRFRDEQGSAAVVAFAMICAILAVAAVSAMRMDLEAGRRRHDALRTQAQWLARSAARNPGSRTITLDRATAIVSSGGGIATARIPGVGTARVDTTSGWRESFEDEKR